MDPQIIILDPESANHADDPDFNQDGSHEVAVVLHVDRP